MFCCFVQSNFTCDSAPCKNRTVYVPEYQWDSYHSECHPEFCGINCDRKGSRNCVKFSNDLSFLSSG